MTKIVNMFKCHNFTFFLVFNYIIVFFLQIPFYFRKKIKNIKKVNELIHRLL